LTDGDRAAFLTWISGARVRIGFNAEHRWTGRCYTRVIPSDPGAHRIERDLSALAPLAIPVMDRIPKMWLTEEDDAAADDLLRRFGVQSDRPWIVIQPGARYWFKAWPPERFAELADRVVDRFGCQVVVAGSPPEAALAQTVVAGAKHRLISIAGLSRIRAGSAAETVGVVRR
jgi:ADP-heptose:LPS heptosyltransferase